MLFRNLGVLGRKRAGLGGFLPSQINGLELWGRWDVPSTLVVDGSNYMQSFTDQSDNNITYSQGTASAQPLYQNSKELYFDGADFIPCDDLYTIAQNDTQGTMCCWYKPVSAITGGGEFILTFGDTNSNSFIGLVKQSNGIISISQRRVGTTYYVLATDDVVTADNTWVHIAVVQNATEPIIYINGVNVAQTFSVSTNKTYWVYFNNAPGYCDNFRIGCRNYNSVGDGSFVNGSMAEPLYYNTALTQPEIQQIYNAKKSLYA